MELLQAVKTSAEFWDAAVGQATAWLRQHDARTRSICRADAPDCTGVIQVIEGRSHPHLEHCLRNAVHFLQPYGWALQVICVKSNEAFVRDIVRGWSNVQITVLEQSELTLQDYNALMCSAEFWERHCPHKHVLTVQTDAMVCAGIPRDSPFLRYAYVGAPWSNVDGGNGRAILPGERGTGFWKDQHLLHELAPNLVGNSGFCLRNRDVMAAVLRKYRRIDAKARARSDAEIPALHDDTFQCVALKRAGYADRIAPREVAVHFALESVLPLRLDPSKPMCVGMHKPYGYQSPQMMELLLTSVRYSAAELPPTVPHV